MKKPKDILETCHQWASGQVDQAKCGNVFFYDDTIYSYGHHFPMARHYKLESGERVALFNPTRYSNSTSKQQSYTRRAWYGNGQSISLPPKHWPQAGTVLTDKDIASLTALATSEAESAAAAEKEYKRERARARRAAKKEAAIPAAQKIQEWRDHKRQSLPWGISPYARMRISTDGKDVETSAGARVGVPLVKRAIKAWRAGKLATGAPVGIYSVSVVSAVMVQVGCHCFEPAEIIRLESELNKVNQ